MRTFLLTPGIAAYLDVKELGDNPQFDHGVIFLSHEKGAVFGSRDWSVNDTTLLPLKVKAAINKHFGTVFALEHETWKQRGQSPRAHYCENLLPWEVQCDDDPA